MRRVVRVGGLPLPGSLLRAIADGRWRPPTDDALLAAVFQDEPDGPQFYDVRTMRRQNKSFQRATPEKFFGIDPAKAVIIGDLGADMPFILDYSCDLAAPRVCFLKENAWIIVASDFDDLLDRLNLAAQ